MRINKKIIISLSLLFTAILLLSCSSQSSPENKQVIAAVDKLFQAIADHDSAKAASVLLPGATIYSVRKDSSGTQWNSTVSDDFIRGLASSEEQWLERMWDPKVLIHKQIAVVWAPYDFHRNQKYSHGGIDVFNLIKTNDGWKIAGAVYTVEPENFKDSPLGKPEF
ncbi:MAG: nuclear transport factor 2 family protein [bacterium]